MENHQAELQYTEMEPGHGPVLPQLDTRDVTLQQPPMPHTPSAASSDHLPFPMLTNNIMPTEYALHWLAGHPGYPM